MSSLGSTWDQVEINFPVGSGQCNLVPDQPFEMLLIGFDVKIRSKKFDTSLIQKNLHFPMTFQNPIKNMPDQIDIKFLS
jgi:hypothetical protein